MEKIECFPVFKGKDMCFFHLLTIQSCSSLIHSYAIVLHKLHKFLLLILGIKIYMNSVYSIHRMGPGYTLHSSRLYIYIKRLEIRIIHNCFLLRRKYTFIRHRHRVIVVLLYLFLPLCPLMVVFWMNEWRSEWMEMCVEPDDVRLFTFSQRCITPLICMPIYFYSEMHNTIDFYAYLFLLKRWMTPLISAPKVILIDLIQAFIYSC